MPQKPKKPIRPCRIALDLTPQLMAMLEEMVKQTGRRRAELIREAISDLYKKVKGEQK